MSEGLAIQQLREWTYAARDELEDAERRQTLVSLHYFWHHFGRKMEKAAKKGSSFVHVPRSAFDGHDTLIAALEDAGFSFGYEFADVFRISWCR